MGKPARRRNPLKQEAGDGLEEALTIYLPGNIRQMLNRTPEELSRDVRLYAALMLFRPGKLSSGAAPEMSGLPRVMFLDLCAEYDIPVSPITANDLHRELGDAQARHRVLPGQSCSGPGQYSTLQVDPFRSRFGHLTKSSGSRLVRPICCAVQSAPFQETTRPPVRAVRDGSC